MCGSGDQAPNVAAANIPAGRVNVQIPDVMSGSPPKTLVPPGGGAPKGNSDLDLSLVSGYR